MTRHISRQEMKSFHYPLYWWQEKSLMKNNNEDFQLIQDILEGEQHHFRILVDRHAPLVFSVVNNFVDDKEMKEELAQEIFVKSYEKLSSFKGKAKFSTWLYRLAMNHCRDYAKNIRRQNKNFSELEDAYLDKHLTDYNLPDEQIEKTQWLNLLRQGLNNINPEYAEAFSLKYERDMTYKAMAQQLDASVSALKVRVFRAKKELKTFIDQHS